MAMVGRSGLNDADNLHNALITTSNDGGSEWRFIYSDNLKLNTDAYFILFYPSNDSS